jgi:hypothetical protein
VVAGSSVCQNTWHYDWGLFRENTVILLGNSQRPILSSPFHFSVHWVYAYSTINNINNNKTAYLLVVYFTTLSQQLDDDDRVTSGWWWIDKDKHPWLKRDSNPRSQRPSD